jgi:hypothetical protein
LDRKARIDRIEGARGAILYGKLNFYHGSKKNIYCPVIKVVGEGESFRNGTKSMEGQNFKSKAKLKRKKIIIV